MLPGAEAIVHHCGLCSLQGWYPAVIGMLLYCLRSALLLGAAAAFRDCSLYWQLQGSLLTVLASLLRWHRVLLLGAETCFHHGQVCGPLRASGATSSSMFIARE